MYRVLLAAHDPLTLEATRALLSRARYRVDCARAGADALTVMSVFNPDVALVDIKLADMTGVDLLRMLRSRGVKLPYVLITRFGHDKLKKEALNLGACLCLDEPLSATLILATVHGVVATGGVVGQAVGYDHVELHAVARWADVVVRAVRARQDIKTLRHWGREVGVSVGGLRNWCSTAGLSAKRSLMFARVLRAVILRRSTAAAPENLMDVVDRRSLAKLLVAAGGTGRELPTDEHEFLRCQTFITNETAVGAVRSALCSLVDSSLVARP